MKIEEIPIKDINVIENHRININDTNLNELMQSIKEHGLEQPIGVAPDKNGKYALIFGHRRMLACQKLGWVKIPATVSKDPSYVEFGRAIESFLRWI